MKMCTIARAQSATVLRVNFHKVWRATLQIMRTVNSCFVCQINLLLHFAPLGENPSSFTLKFLLLVVIIVVCRLSFSLKISFQFLQNRKPPRATWRKQALNANAINFQLQFSLLLEREWKFAVEFIICIIKMMTNGVDSSTKPRCELWMLWKNPCYNFSLLHDKDKTFSATFWVLFWLQFAKMPFLN